MANKKDITLSLNDDLPMQSPVWHNLPLPSTRQAAPKRGTKPTSDTCLGHSPSTLANIVDLETVWKPSKSPYDMVSKEKAADEEQYRRPRRHTHLPAAKGGSDEDVHPRILSTKQSPTSRMR